MLFKIYWQHNYMGKGLTDHVSEPDREFENKEAAEAYAKALTIGSYSVEPITPK